MINLNSTEQIVDLLFQYQPKDTVNYEYCKKFLFKLATINSEYLAQVTGVYCKHLSQVEFRLIKFVCGPDSIYRTDKYTRSYTPADFEQFALANVFPKNSYELKYDAVDFESKIARELQND